eukprot:COSAG06_NODE_75_length_25804_cov_247.408364_6_plen_4151_part_00
MDLPDTPRGGPDNISKKEYEDLTKKLKTVERHTAKKDRSWWHNALLKLSWWHVVLVIVINDIMLIAVGSLVGSAFYSIEPIKDGSFRAERIEVEGLAIDPDNGAVLVELESEDRGAELSLRSFAGEASRVTISDLTAPREQVFALQSKQEQEGQDRTLKLQQGDVSRLTITESLDGNGTDVWLDPSEKGRVVVKGGLALDFNRIETSANQSLDLMPAVDQDLILQPTGNGQVVVHHQLTMFESTVTTVDAELNLRPAHSQDLVLEVTDGGHIRMNGPWMQDGGAVSMSSNLTVADRTELNKVHVFGNIVLDEDITLGDAIEDKVDINGHIKSCGTSAIEKYFCDQSKLIFDPNDDGVALTVYVPDPQDGFDYEITFPVETGELLTTVSKDSELIRVGALEQGSLVYGFGSAEVSSLTSRGASNLFGDATIGISRDNQLNIKGHISEEALVFDYNSDGVRYIIKVPDPSANKDELDCYISTGSTDECVRQGIMGTAQIDFPDETGTILTHVSKVSQLEEVGDLKVGSIQPGFGEAHVSSLSVHRDGYSYLAGDVRLGETSSNTLNIQARILNENLIFDANSDGASMSIWIPDPLLSQTIHFPERSGELLTDTSTYSVLTHVDELVHGSILEGFGPIHAESFKSTGDAILYDDVTLGDVLTDVVEINGHIVSHAMVYDANSDRSSLTIHYPDPPQGSSHHISFPLEDGSVLTTMSPASNLTEVADLHRGSLVEGFGSATITDLHATGDAELDGHVSLCSTRENNLEIKGAILDDELVMKHPAANGNMYSMKFPTTTETVEVMMPLQQFTGGFLLSDQSLDSNLAKVGELTAGTIQPGFGEIHTTDAIQADTVTSEGLFRAFSSAEFGSQPGDRVSFEASIAVRGRLPNGTMRTNFAVDPATGNTMVRGVLTVEERIEALAAPFYVDSVHADKIVELVENKGVQIEGMTFIDGGFPFAKTDYVTEHTEGQGVDVEGVKFKDGALTAESTVAGTSPIGNIDLATLINEGRDFLMAGTTTSIKFRQWHQGIPDNRSYASDSGALTVGTESDWREDLSSRSSYMGMSTVYQGNMVERVHIHANGDFDVNDQQFVSFEETGNAYISGNVSVGEHQEGARELLVQSEDLDATIKVVSKMRQATVSVEAGEGYGAMMAVVGGPNDRAVVRLQDPAPELEGSIFDWTLDGNVYSPIGRRMEEGVQENSTQHTMRLTNVYNEYICNNITEVVGVLNPRNVSRMVCAWMESAPLEVMEITSDPAAGVGNIAVTGKTTTLTANVRSLLEAENTKIYGDTQIGDDWDDRIEIYGSISNENVTIDVGVPGENPMILQFLEPSQPRVITYPDEDGRVLTTSSNYSTLRAVAELTVGSIGRGFGHAEVASLGADGDIQSKGEIIFGDDAADGVNINGHFRETQLVFDPNSDFITTTITITDPSPQLPPFDEVCQLVNGSAHRVYVPWEHEDFRMFKWTDSSLTPDEGLQALTNEVINLISVPIPENTTDILFENFETQNASLYRERTIEDVNCAWTCVVSPYEHCGFNNGSVVVGLTLDDAACTGADDGTGSPCALNEASCEATVAGVDDVECANVELDEPSILRNQAKCTSAGACTYTVPNTGCAVNGGDCVFSPPTIQNGIQEVMTLRDKMFAYMIQIIQIQLEAANNNASNTLKMPNADGTLLYKHNGETHLDGDVYLGETPEDTVYIPGIVAGNVRMLAHISGKKIDEAGEDTSCVNKPLYWTAMTCEQAVPSILSIGAATCSNYWSLLGITGEDTPIGDWCPMQCWARCHANGTALRFKNKDMDPYTYSPDGTVITGENGEEMILAVPQYTTSQVLTLPDNSGDILSDASKYSTLEEVGTLKYLNVAGPTALVGATSVGGFVNSIKGTGVAGRSDVYMDGVITQPAHSSAPLGSAGAELATARSMSFGGELYGQSYVASCNVWNYPCLHTPQDPLGACSPTGCPETCTAQPVDTLVCGAVLLDGTAETCESAGRCTYQPLDLINGIAESCYPTYDAQCSAVVVDGNPDTCLVIGRTCLDEVIEVHKETTNIVHDSDSTTGPRANILSQDEQTLILPRETGTLISSGSDFQVITGLGDVAYGNLVTGFGDAEVASLRVTGHSYLDGDSTIGSSGDSELTFLGNIVGESAMFFEGTVSDDNDLTVKQPAFSQPRSIFMPDEDGRFLTTTSVESVLEEVGALRIGSIVEGFGAAHVASMTVTGRSTLNGPVQLGDDPAADFININGYIRSQLIKFDGDGIGGSMSLSFSDPPQENAIIRFPTYDGTVVLDTTKTTGITGTAALEQGSIIDTFGPITVGQMGGISTTNGQPIISDGDLVSNGATVFSSDGVEASANIIIPDDRTLVRITIGNGENPNFFTMPSGEAGEMLVIQNDDDKPCTPLDAGLIETIPAADTAVFFHIGVRWVEISRLLDWSLDGSSENKIPFTSGSKRLTNSGGLYYQDELDMLTVKSSNDQAKLAMESKGNCPGHLPHESACRENTTRYTLQLDAQAKAGTEMVPLQMKVKHVYGQDMPDGTMSVISSIDNAMCEAVTLNGASTTCTNIGSCAFTADDAATPDHDPTCGPHDACAAVILDGQTCKATDETVCAGVILDGNSATCTDAGACAYTPPDPTVDPAVEESCAAIALDDCAAVSNDAGMAGACALAAGGGCSYFADDDQAQCESVSACTYTPDDPLTSAVEEACKGTEHDITVDIVEEKCEATDAAVCASVDISDPDIAISEAACSNAGACTYVPEDLINTPNVVEACHATLASECSAVVLNGYPATCEDILGCTYTAANGLTDYRTIEKTLLSMGDAYGMVLSDLNVTMVPAFAMAVRDAAGKNDLFAVNTNVAGSENIDIHAPSMTLSAGTWPDETQSTCDPCFCDTDGVVSGWDTDRAGCWMHYFGDTVGAIARAADQGLTSTDKFCMVHPDCIAAGVGCDAVTVELQAGTANEYSCTSAGSCVYTPDDPSTAGTNEASCTPMAAGVINMCTDYDYDGTEASCIDRHPGKCVYTPDDPLTGGLDEESCDPAVPGYEIPFKRCVDTDPDTDCNDPDTANTEETSVHGDMTMYASRYALQRKTVDYMIGRNNRIYTDVIAFDNEGTLQITDKKVDVMASESFNLYSPVAYSASGRRRLGYVEPTCAATDIDACKAIVLDGAAATCTGGAPVCSYTQANAATDTEESCVATHIDACTDLSGEDQGTCEASGFCTFTAANGNTVFGFSNLNNVGSEAASLSVKDLTMSATGTMSMDTGKLSYSIDGVTAFEMDPAAGIRISNEMNPSDATKTVTIVTGKTVFRNQADTADIVTVDTSTDGNEKLILNTPEMNFDARTTMQDGINKYGGSMTISALKTVLQTSVSQGLNRNVDVLTVEDAGILCEVTVRATMGAMAANYFYYIDFDEDNLLSSGQCTAGPCCGRSYNQACSPTGSGEFHGPYDPDDEFGRGIRTNSPWQDNARYEWTLQIAGGEHFLQHYSTTGYGWYGSDVTVLDASGAVIGQSPASIASDGSRTYFSVGASGECERVEARINSEYTAIRNRAGTTSYITINAEEEATSSITVYAPTVTVGAADSAVTMNGRTVTLQAGSSDALVLMNDGPLCAAYELVGVISTDTAACEAIGDCEYVGVSADNAIAKCQGASQTIDSKWDMTFTGKATFNAGIEMGKSVESVGFRAGDVTLGNIDTCVPTDKAACESATLNGNPTTCTNQGDCDHTPATADTPESCVASYTDACMAVDVDGTQATCEATTGCSYVPPAGTVNMIGETTKLQGQDILIQGKCKDTGNMVAAGTFNYVAAHCEALSTGATLSMAQAACEASTAATWVLGSCYSGAGQSSANLVEYGKSQTDCDNRAANANSDCMDGADHEPSTVRVSANRVKLQADGLDIITLTSQNSLGKYYESSPYELGDDTAVEFTADTISFANKAKQLSGGSYQDSDDLIKLTTAYSAAGSDSAVVLSAETVQIGKKYFDPLRFVWDGTPGLNGKCSPQYNGDGSAKTEAQCGSGAWTPSTCTRVTDNTNMQSGGYETECLERNYAGQTTNIEGTTVTLSAADQVQLEAPNMINMMSDVMMSRQVAFSYEEHEANSEITISADATMVVILNVAGIQQNSITLPTVADGSDVGNMLMVYNADDDLAMTNSGNISPGTSGIFFRASIGWICGTCA